MDKLPNAHLHWIEKCGHAPMLESPDEFARAMLEFVQRLNESDRNDPA